MCVVETHTHILGRGVPVGSARAEALLKDQQMVGSESALSIALGSECGRRTA